MSNKTSQLQIRVSPEEKRALKRLAAAAGMTVSRYVMSTVLPTLRVEFTERAHDLSGRADGARSLAELRSFLTNLSAEELTASVSALDAESLPPVLRNLVAAVVEHAAWLHEQRPPAWTRGVEPLERPYFARDLQSLRLHQMRVTPVTLKRRNAFMELDSRDDRPPPGTVALTPALARLAEEVAARGILAEVCTSDGGLVLLALSAEAGTRNPTAVFQPPEALEEAVRAVDRGDGSGADWLAEEARMCVGPGPNADGFVDLAHLRVYEARPDYLLAMKCASLRAGVPPGAAADVRRLARALGLATAEDALRVVGRYFAERHLVPAARTLLAEALREPAAVS